MINEKEQVKELIKSGFDLELISFELEIPLTQVKRYAKQMENNYSYSKLQLMREKYRKILNDNSRAQRIQEKQLSNQEIELIENIIATVEGKVQEILNSSQGDKEKIATQILKEIEKLTDYQLPLEYAEKAYNIMHSEDLQNLKLTIVSKVRNYINKAKRITVSGLAKSIGVCQSKTEDLEELKALYRKLTTEMAKENPVIVDGVKSKVNSKISKIKQQIAIDRIKNDISPNVLSVITGLTNGTADINNVKLVIEEEAKQRIDNRTKTRFSLTEEQEKKQILIQIRMAIIEKAEIYHIKDPENAVLQLQELFDGNLTDALKIVVQNLIERREIESAKSICDRFSSKDKQSDIAKCIRNLKDEIRKAEISDIVLEGIKMQGTVEEENAYFGLIEKGIRMGNVKLHAISIGKTENGLKNITLADIWPQENEKKEKGFYR